MKKTFLNLQNVDMYKVPSRYAPMITNRHTRMARASMGVAYKGDGDDDPEAQKIALLEKVKTAVRTECETQGFKKESDITAMITQALSGLDLESLKSFKPADVKQSVTNVAAELEKIKNNMATFGEGAVKKLDALKRSLQSKKFLDKVEQVFVQRGGSIKLDAREAAVIMTTSNVTDNDDVPDDILDSFSVDTFVKKRQPREYIYDIATRRTVPKITEYKTWLEEGDIDGNFAIVAEGGLKPLVSATLVRNISKYRKAAGKRVYTEEFAKFKTEAYNLVEDIINDKLLRDYANILQVDLLTWAAGYVGTTLDGLYDEPTDYHAIGAVAAQIESLDFVPDLLVLNPQDKWRIGLQQATDGHFFVNIPMVNPSGVVQMLGFRVLTTTKLAAGTFMLGESGLYKIEDEPISVRLGYGITVTKDGANVTEVESDVDHNRFRIIAETFFHDYVATNHTGAFVEATFDSVKLALTAP